MNNKENSPLNEPYVVEAETTPEIKFDNQPTTSQPLEMKKRFQLVKKGPLTKKEKIYFTITIFAILLIGGGLIWWMNSQPWLYAVEGSNAPVKEVKYYSLLNGLQVDSEEAIKRTVTAVMIENSPDARPQSGLAEAEVVFEAVAEGGITRFIALYQNSQPGLIGPVRSLRPYYAEWAAAFDPSVAHVGGSPEALTMIRSGNYGVDIDQFFNAGSYWRAADRYAPHNVYTNSERLNTLNAAKNKKVSSFAFAPRIDEKKVETPNATAISVSVSSGLFDVSYAYDAASNSYHRRQGGVAHTDREKGQIAPKVVIAMKTNISIAADGQHRIITTTGSGPAYIFQNGTVVQGTWSKAGTKERLTFNDDQGKEIPLVRGQTWITTVAMDRNVSWQ